MEFVSIFNFLVSYPHFSFETEKISWIRNMPKVSLVCPCFTTNLFLLSLCLAIYILSSVGPQIKVINSHAHHPSSPAQPLLVDLLATRANYPMSSLHSFILSWVQMYSKFRNYKPISRAFDDKRVHFQPMSSRQKLFYYQQP